MNKMKISSRLVLSVAVALFAGTCLEAGYTYDYHHTKQSWSKAETECKDHGMMLLKIKSLHELDQLYTQLGYIISGGEIWTGLYTEARCTDYTWSDGDLATWTRWHPDEPNKCSTEKCVRLADGKMRTSKCSTKHRFICQTQKEITSTSTTTETETTTISSTEATTTGKQEITSTSTTNPTTETETTAISSTKATTTGKQEITSTSTTNPTTETETTAISSTEATTTGKQESTSRSSLGSTNGTSSWSDRSEHTTSSLVDGTKFSTESIIGNITCLCDENSMNNTVGRRGIIPSSLAHQTNLLKSGYFPACLKNIEWGNGSTLMSGEKKVELLNNLKKQLKLAKDTTSLSRRKRISAPDNRTSATSVGVIGICVLVALFGTILLIDASTMYTHYKKSKGNAQ